MTKGGPIKPLRGATRGDKMSFFVLAFLSLSHDGVVSLNVICCVE